MRLIFTLSICVFLTACITPSDLLLKGESDRAFKKALRNIKRDKNVIANTEVVLQAGDQITKNTIAQNSGLIRSSQVKDWTRAQKNFDKQLKDIFAANDLVNGKLQSSYDELCTEKIELDFKIADHFFQLGENLLATHYEQLSKHHAREAYFEFQECLSYGGDRFFQNIEDKMLECVQEGRIFFVSHRFTPSTNIFFQPLPRNSPKEPDCDIVANFGHTHFSENSHTAVQSFSEEVKVGVETVVDTAGVTHHYPIYKTVYGSVNTITVTLTAESTTYIDVDNVTGYCFKSSNRIRSCASDSYQIVELTGDRRAIPRRFSKKRGDHQSTVWRVERALDSKIDSELFYW